MSLYLDSDSQSFGTTLNGLDILIVLLYFVSILAVGLWVSNENISIFYVQKLNLLPQIKQRQTYIALRASILREKYLYSAPCLG